MKVQLSNIPFKSYTQVRLFIKPPQGNTYYPVASPYRFSSCTKQLTQYLNQTSKNINQKFVDYYSSYDKDYVENPHVHKVTDKDTPYVYFVSGKDVEPVVKYGQSVGLAKSKSKKLFGHSKSYDSRLASNDYFSKVKNFLKNNCSSVKDIDGSPVFLSAYFESRFDKKKGEDVFDFVGAEFGRIPSNNPRKDPDLSMHPQQPKYKQMSFFDLM